MKHVVQIKRQYLTLRQQWRLKRKRSTKTINLARWCWKISLWNYNKSKRIHGFFLVVFSLSYYSIVMYFLFCVVGLMWFGLVCMFIYLLLLLWYCYIIVIALVLSLLLSFYCDVIIWFIYFSGCVCVDQLFGKTLIYMIRVRASYGWKIKRVVYHQHEKNFVAAFVANKRKQN